MTSQLPPTDGICERLQLARNRLGHTQTEAAEAMGMSMRHWQRIERGEVARSVRTMLLVNLYLEMARLEQM